MHVNSYVHPWKAGGRERGEREREREAARARESETAERLGGGLTRRAWLGSWLDVGLWHFELHRMLQIIVNRRGCQIKQYDG